jgi:hypothetical protein
MLQNPFDHSAPDAVAVVPVVVAAVVDCIVQLRAAASTSPLAGVLIASIAFKSNQPAVTGAVKTGKECPAPYTQQDKHPAWQAAYHNPLVQPWLRGMS